MQLHFTKKTVQKKSELNFSVQPALKKWTIKSLGC